ncbi:MAG: hypothetical protein SRB1_01210 [Desulfobacteraceae bacterium Eth-SRB1]|nr:MAG: hypothetical protein SRB1_01210 [Desulfobacteraceae bacterium Eth-SRB1]
MDLHKYKTKHIPRISFTIGKRTLETCKEMIKDMFYRMELPFPDNKIEIYSDGNDEYTSTLKDFYCETCITYGQLIKIKAVVSLRK